MTRRVSIRLTWTLAIAAALVVALAYILYNPLRIHHDCAMFLQVGSLLLDGRLMYVDVVDLNPPLISYLNVIPAAVSRALGTHPIPTFLIGVWCLTVASVVATRTILRETFQEDEASDADLIAASLAVFSVAVLWWNMYGQREHLFVLGFFPYLALRFRRWEDGQAALVPSMVVGLLAGVAACLKPHFVAIALAPELYWVLTRRSRRPLVRPEVLMFVGAGLAYALHFLVIPADMRAAYFGRWIPFVARGYHAYDMPLRRLVLEQEWLWLPAVACATVFLFKSPAKGTSWRLAGPVAAVALMSVASLFVQHKGWVYHAIPAQAAAVVAAALLAARVRGARMGHAFTGMPWLGTAMLVVTAVMLSSASALAAAFAFRPRTEERVAEQLQYSAAARAIVRYSRPGEPVLILATSTATPYPLLTQLSRQPAARYLEDFPIPMFYYGATGTPGQVFPYRTGSGTVPEDERLFLDELRADIERARPKLILVDDRRTCDWCPEGFGLHEYLVKNHFIADALVRYRGAGKAGDFVVYLPDGIPAS